MAVDAAFGDVNAAAMFHGGPYDGVGKRLDGGTNDEENCKRSSRNDEYGQGLDLHRLVETEGCEAQRRECPAYPGQNEKSRGHSNKRRRNMMKVLGHPNTHGGADPSCERIERAGATGASSLGRGFHQKRGESDERHGVERHADRVEYPGHREASRIEEQQASGAKEAYGKDKSDRNAAAGQEPSADQRGDEMQRPGSPEVKITLPGSCLEMRG